MFDRERKNIQDLGGTPAAAATIIGGLIATQLVGIADPYEWPEDGYIESSSNKRQIPGMFASYEEYVDAEEWGHPVDEDEWERSRSEYLPRQAKIEGVLDALELLAAEFHVPFDRDLALHAARGFAAMAPQWDMSVC